MTNKIKSAAAILLAALLLAAPLSLHGATPQSQHRAIKHRHPQRKKLLKKGGWAGAGFAAGHVAGPAGSAAVGAAKYRKDLKAGGKKRAHAVAKIGGPIAAGAV